MRPVRYTRDALKALKRHGNMAEQIMKAVREYADNPTAHANNVIALKGSTALRLRIGDFRIIFNETDVEIIVTDIGPRGEIYD